MNKKEIVELLSIWQSRYFELDKQLTALRNITKGDTESPLELAIWLTWDAYTTALSQLVGDTGGWLDYYNWECNMGKTPLKVILSDDEDEITLLTLNQLATVIMKA